MFKLLFTVLLLFMPAQFALCAHPYPEKYYQNQWCTQWHGVQEYRLSDKTRIDCLTRNYATEFDFAPKWAEAIGQSLYYSKKTGKKPAIILIIEKPTDFKYYHRAKTLASDLKIALWYIKSPAYANNTKSLSAQSMQTNFEKIIKDLHKTISNYI